MTMALEGGEWSAARPGQTLPPGKTRYPLYRKLGGPQGRSGWAENLVPPGCDHQLLGPLNYDAAPETARQYNESCRIEARHLSKQDLDWYIQHKNNFID